MFGLGCLTILHVIKALSIDSSWSGSLHSKDQQLNYWRPWTWIIATQFAKSYSNVLWIIRIPFTRSMYGGMRRSKLYIWLCSSYRNSPPQHRPLSRKPIRPHMHSVGDSTALNEKLCVAWNVKQLPSLCFCLAGERGPSGVVDFLAAQNPPKSPCSMHPHVRTHLCCLRVMVGAYFQQVKCPGGSGAACLTLTAPKSLSGA